MKPSPLWTALYWTGETWAGCFWVKFGHRHGQPISYEIACRLAQNYAKSSGYKLAEIQPRGPVALGWKQYH